MSIPFEVKLLANKKVLYIIKMIVSIIGFTAIFLTLNFYKCEWLRVVFIYLGVTGLIALLLFLLNGSFCVFGIFGSISLVLILHYLVLKQIKNDLNKKICKDPCSEIISECTPIIRKKKIINEIIDSINDEKNLLCKGFKVLSQKLKPCKDTKSHKLFDKCAPKCCDIEKKLYCNEIKFTESYNNSCYGSKYKQSYHKKSNYNNCSDKSCKKCSCYSNVQCRNKPTKLYNKHANYFNEMFVM
jgi:hypothetical protein